MQNQKALFFDWSCAGAALPTASPRLPPPENGTRRCASLPRSCICRLLVKPWSLAPPKPRRSSAGVETIGRGRRFGEGSVEMGEEEDVNLQSVHNQNDIGFRRKYIDSS